MFFISWTYNVVVDCGKCTCGVFYAVYSFDYIDVISVYLFVFWKKYKIILKSAFYQLFVVTQSLTAYWSGFLFYFSALLMFIMFLF